MQYLKTIEQIENQKQSLAEELTLFKKTQVALLRNDFYQIKDRDTQSIFESILKINQPKEPHNNHQKAYDLKFSGEKISIKSGTVKNGDVTISYSRTSSYPTLEDKIAYLSTFDNLILGIGSEQTKPSNSHISSTTSYYLYYFQANEIDLKNMNWNETENSWQGHSETTGISVDIRKKMSSQPWIKLPSSFVNAEKIITSSVLIKDKKKFLVIDDFLNQQKHYFNIYQIRKALLNIQGTTKCLLSSTNPPSL